MKRETKTITFQPTRENKAYLAKFRKVRGKVTAIINGSLDAARFSPNGKR